MRNRSSTNLRRIPATVIGFVVVVVIVQATTLAQKAKFVRERPLWAAFGILLILESLRRS